MHNVIFEPKEEDGSYIQTASLPIDLQPTATLTNDLAGAAFSFRPSVVSPPIDLMEGLRVEISRGGVPCRQHAMADNNVDRRLDSPDMTDFIYHLIPIMHITLVQPTC